MRIRSAITLAVTIAFAAPLGTAPLSFAGDFTINACGADRTDFASVAFDDFASRGMMWRRACNPQGPGLRGLIVGNVVRNGQVPSGAQSLFVLDAPPGTAFTRFRWSGQARRSSCRYALQLYADRPGGAPIAIKNVPANRGCPRPKRAQARGWPEPQDFDVSGATRIVQRVVCSAADGCSARARNYILTFSAQATVADPIAPTVTVTQDNPFTQGAWVRGTQTVSYDAGDNTGVRMARIGMANLEGTADPRACNYALRIPCPNGPGQIKVDTQLAPDGTQPLTVRAEDAAGNPADSAAVTVRIDNTAPGATTVSVDSGDAWRNRNDFDLHWSNPPEGDRAPIAAATYQLCRAGTNNCTTASRSTPGINHIDDVPVPSPGEWDVRVWRADAAGNEQPTNASVPLRLRYDPEPPTLAFDPTIASDPTQVSVTVNDAVSGLADGTIEIGREGSNTWQALQTSRNGARLVARVDDTQLAPGTYLLRATANDQAGNQASSDRRMDGQPAILTLPLRAATVMQAGKVATRRVRQTVGRRGHRRKVWRRQTVLAPTAHVGFGRPVQIAGRLTYSDGQPIGGAEIVAVARTPDGAEQPAGTLATDASGQFAYLAHATTTQTLRFVYQGSPVILPAQDEVAVFTRGKSSLTVSDHRTVNGRAVTFSGQIYGRPLPAAGKLVEMQVHLSREWETFRTTRSSVSGTWSIRYRFTRTCGGLQRFRFRALLPKESGYPFDEGASKMLAVRVRGRPCSR